MASEKYNMSWEEFTQETTMHGIKNVKARNVSSARRTAWGMFIFLLVGYFIFASYLFLSDYAKNLVNTTVKVTNTPNQSFPKVTICNRNFWKKSFMVNDSISSENANKTINLLMDLYDPNAQSPPPEGKYNWSDPLLTEIVNGVIPMWLQMSHGLNETFLRCIIKTNTVPCHQVLHRVITDAGICYQFNGDGKFEVNSAGSKGGAQFLLDTLTPEYYVGPYSYSEGFFVSLLPQNEFEILTDLSYGVAPGTDNSMIIHKTSIKRKPPPAYESNCFNTATTENPLQFFSSYTYSGCCTECQVAFVVSKCGYRHFTQIPLAQTEVAPVEQLMTCVIPAIREFYTHPEHLKACDCRPLCEEKQFSAEISALKYPSEGYISQLDISKEDYEYQAKNHALISIYFGQMSYDQIEERDAFTPYDLVANIGGTLGVCIGASLLTVIEFIEHLFLTLSACISFRWSMRGNKTPVKIFQPDLAFENEEDIENEI